MIYPFPNSKKYFNILNIIYRKKGGRKMTLTIILVVSISLGILIVGFLISSLITIQLMKKAQKKAFDSLDSLVAYERNRFDGIKEIADYLDQSNRLHAQSIIDTIKKQEEAFSSDTIDMQNVKVTDDFLVIYFQKYIKEKNLSKKSPYDEYLKKLSEELTIDPEDKEHPYYKYNKLALKYNSYANMRTASWYARRKNYPQAPVM